MVVVRVVGLLVAAALAAVNGYQAITGRRLSKRPSSRPIEQMRRQSTIAAVAITALIGLDLAVIVIRGSWA